MNTRLATATLSPSTTLIDTTAYGIAALRASLGVMAVAHGLLKLLVFTPAGTAAYFASLGLPPLLGWVTMLAEIGGGALLLIGYQTRLTAAALIPLLLGAAIFGHGKNGWVFSNTGGGWEYPVFLAAASFAQALLGAGAWALDSAQRGRRGAPN